MQAALQIAGVRIELRGEPAPSSVLEDFGPFAHLATPPEATIALDLHTREMAPGPAAFTYARHNLRFELEPDGRTARAWTDGTAGPVWAAIELALHAALAPLGGFVVHGAAGVVDGTAWLFPGESGAGKSTIARGAGFDRVLGDEMAVVRRAAHGFAVWGTPFWSNGRTLPLDPGGAPLALLADPVKSDAVAVLPWPRPQAAAGLLACVTSYEETPAARGRAFDLACDLVEAVPCVRPAFPKEGPWLPAARMRVMRAASSSTPSGGPSRSGSSGTSPGGATTSASTAT
jgi:hypothetical protein